MALQPRPRDLTLATWQSSVTDEHIEKIVLGGGQSVGLSMLMPANPDLAGKPFGHLVSLFARGLPLPPAENVEPVAPAAETEITNTSGDTTTTEV